jgi:polyhydroxybutyrate depolymerase
MPKKFQLILLLGFLASPAAACVRPLAAATPGTAEAAGLASGETTRTLSHGGRERSYILYVPPSVDWSRPVPLVFVFHGGTGNARSAANMSGFDSVADANGFLVVYPNGTGRFSDDVLLTWNGGDCCGSARENNVDDVGFVRAMVADLQSRITVDPRRIYAAGMSNGALLSQRLACEAADLIAAIGPVSGTLNFAPCTPARPVSVIEFHGTADEHIPYDGGIGPRSLTRVDFASVPETIGFWTAFDRCASPPQTVSTGDVRHDTWGDCADSAAVELYTIAGGGHAWPGGQKGEPLADQPTASISASELIWQFFAAHPKP